MAETATVPVVGKVPKRELEIGVVVVVTLIGVYFYRKHQAGSAPATAAASATTTDQYPPDGTTGNPQDPYSTDPATGATYGDEATGSGGTYGAYGYNSYGSNGIIGYDSAGNPVYAPGYAPSGSTSSAGGPPFSNNSAWSQYAIQTMTASNPSLDVGALTDALGLYLAGQPVSAAQKTLIFDAIAVAGDPPVAGPNNYPPNVQTNAGYTPPAGESLVGSGYNAGTGTGQGSTITGQDGHVYTWASPAVAAAAVAAHEQLYYQASPGVFVPTPPGATFGQGTPLYTRTS